MEIYKFLTSRTKGNQSLMVTNIKKFIIIQSLKAIVTFNLVLLEVFIALLYHGYYLFINIGFFSLYLDN